MMRLLKNYAVGTLAYFVALATLFTFAFDSNDDAAMMGIASGFFTGRGHDALVFSSLWFGKALVWLYTVFPAWNWYVLLHLVMLYAALATIGHIMSGTFRREPRLLLIVALLVAPAVVAMQYTITAMLCGFAGWLLFWRGRPVLGGVFLLVATMIRWHALLTLLLFSLPLLCFLWAQRGVVARLFRRQVAAVLLAVALLCVYRWSEAFFYEKYYDYPEVFAYQSALDKVVSGPGDVDHALLAGIGWDETDLRLVRAWCPLDAARHGTWQIMALAPSVHGSRSCWKAGAQAYGLVLSDWGLLAALGIGLLYRVLVQGGNNLHVAPPTMPDQQTANALFRKIYNIRRENILLYIQITTLALFSGYAFFCFRLPHRLFYPIALTQLLTWIYLAALLSPRHGSRTPSAGPLAKRCFAAAVLLLCAWLLQIGLQNGTKRRAADAAFDKIRRDPDTLVLVRGAELPYEGLWSLRNPNAKSAQNILPTGWILNTPAYKALLQKHNIENLLQATQEPHNWRFVEMPLDDMEHAARRE